MTFQRNKGFGKIRKEKTAGLVHKIKKNNCRWYTADWCGYCKVQKKILNDIDPHLLQFVKENDKNVPKGINGYPALYIPADSMKDLKGAPKDKDGNILPAIIPGFKNEKQLFQIVSQLP